MILPNASPMIGILIAPLTTLPSNPTVGLNESEVQELRVKKTHGAANPARHTCSLRLVAAL